MPETADRLNRALAGRYVIEREIGAGGMATVFLARDERHGRRVALKLLRADIGAVLGAERFLSEIRVTANLQHPNLLPLFDSGNVDGMLFYVMPFVDGESLRQRLDRERQLPVDDAIRIAVAVAGALQYAHERGVIHRDLKPENILLHAGQPVVADFGIALAVSNAGGARVTQTGLSLGTPQYMSPEQATGDRVIDARTDIYSLGAVLYEMLSGDPPHSGSTAQAIIARLLTERPRGIRVSRPVVPEGIEIAVERALEKLPADRFASADEFRNALLNPTSVVRTTVGPASVAGAPDRRRLALMGAAIAAVAAMGVLAGTQFARPAPSSPAPVARFAVDLGDVQLRSDNSPVISLDGSRIAFPGVDTANRIGLYVRSLDRELPISLTGDRWDPNTAFFSPDGQMLGFLVGGQMRRIALASGTITPIVGATGSWSLGTWGKNDVIVYGLSGSLWQIPAAGGAPKLIVAADSTRDEIFGAPNFLPDGRHVVLEIADTSGVQLAIVSVGDGKIRRLGIEGRSPHYVDGGWLVYVTANGTIMAAPFDLRSLSVTGEAAPIASGVTINTHARMAVSRTGTIVYYSTIQAGDRELVLVNRNGTVEPFGLPMSRYRLPRFSPDGKRVALLDGGSGDGRGGDIWVLDIASKRMERLTSDSTALGVEWTSDGKWLVFSRRIGAENAKVWRIPSTPGGEPAPLFESTRPVFDPILTERGDSIVFRVQQGYNRDIHVAAIDNPGGARALAATPRSEQGAALSPDGRWLAYTSNFSGRAQVYVRRMSDSNERWQVSAAAGGAEVRWGANGREVLYRRGDSVFAAAVTLGTEAVAGREQFLFAGRYQGLAETRYDVTRDGSKFVMVKLENPGRGTTLHVVMNWFDNARRR